MLVALSAATAVAGIVVPLPLVHTAPAGRRWQAPWNRVKVTKRTTSTARQVRVLRASVPDRDDRLAAQAADQHVATVMAHSQIGGRYLVVSDLHWGPGSHDPREAFRQAEAFARFVTWAARQPNTTLVIAGDWLELMDFVDPDADTTTVARTVTATLRGHEVETRALVDAVVHGGLRVLYLRGNHDVHLVEPDVRTALVSGLAQVAQLDRAGTEVLRSRIAFSGHCAVLGKSGEGLVIHGDAVDLFNNWRSPVNPRDAHLRIQPTLAWLLSRRVVGSMRVSMPFQSELRRKLAGWRHVLASAPGFAALLRLHRDVFLEPLPDTPVEVIVEGLDDRDTMRHWVARTGFHRMVAAKTGAPASVRQTARALDEAYRTTAPPALDRMHTGFLGKRIGLLKVLVDRARRLRVTEPRMLRAFWSIGEVYAVLWGHSHKETALQTAGKLHLNTGTWVREKAEDRLNAVLLTTDADGRLHADIDSSRRVDPLTGEPRQPSVHRKERLPRLRTSPRHRSPAGDGDGEHTVAAPVTPAMQ